MPLGKHFKTLLVYCYRHASSGYYTSGFVPCCMIMCHNNHIKCMSFSSHTKQELLILYALSQIGFPCSSLSMYFKWVIVCMLILRPFSTLCAPMSGKWFLRTDMDILFSSKTYIWRDLEIPAYQIPNNLLIGLRSNSKFNKNLGCSGLKYAQTIKTKFCTGHDSATVVTCTKFCCDRHNMLWTRALQSFIEFQIRSKYR